ncbi:MAG TPA: NADPH:quinone oxidoreductase family protein [Bryobacteraceae bacterium]|nr:NADPH:quinone oxidoreductase family protein [Bryobacteraceae bacterium]
MKSWRVHAWSEPETMVLEEIPEPEPAPGQVRIRNRAAALNFFDILQVQGKYQVKPPFPFTPGAEVAGIVDAIGEGVASLKVGDRVMAMTHGGGFAAVSVAPASNVFPMPAKMSFEEAAAMPIAYHTSYFAFTHRTWISAGEWVLVHAGASGVGTSAIQIAKAMGARVIGTAGSEAKLAFAKQQGADEALDYSGAGWVDRVKQITGHGADVIYDPVGGDVFDLSTRCIAPEGRLLVIGFASGKIPSIAANRVLLKNISLVGVLWGGYVQSHPEYSATVHPKLMELYEAGSIRPAVGATYALEETPRGMRDLADRKVIGKAVVSLEGMF